MDPFTEQATQSLGRGPFCQLRLPPLVVVVVHVQEHVPARYARVQFGADEEGAGHLAVEGVGLLRWRGEAVPQHDGDEVLDALGSALYAEVKGLQGRKGLSEDHHRLHVSFLEGLYGAERGIKQPVGVEPDRV